MDSQVQEIKDKLNIVDIVGQYVTLKRGGRTYMARCPFHNERTPSFHVSPERGTYKCFGCGEGGDIFTFVEKMEGVDFPTALKQLAEKAGVKLEKKFIRPEVEIKREERLIEICNEATRFFQAQLQKRKDVLDYIHTRGVTDHSVDKWKLGYAPATWDDLSKYLTSKNFSTADIIDSGLAVKSDKRPDHIFDRFRGRIMFPITGSGGNVIAFSGRFFEDIPNHHTDNEAAKYINSPETLIFRKSRVLYGYDQAMPFMRKLDCILLVEGQFDLVMAHQSGLPFSVALSGTALTDEHLNRLGKLSKRLVIALDADPAGLRSGLKSTYMALRDGFQVKIPTFPEGKDPADLARENPELLKAAISTSEFAIEFFLKNLLKLDKNSHSYKKLVEKEILPLIAVTPSLSDENAFIDMVRRYTVMNNTRYETEAIRSELEQIRFRIRNQPRDQENTPEVQTEERPSLTSFEKKVGMLLFHQESHSEETKRLYELLGEARIEQLKTKLFPYAEELRFRFDNEISEQTTESVLVNDILKDIERTIMQEKLGQARLAGDIKKTEELARRAQGLTN